MLRPTPPECQPPLTRKGQAWRLAAAALLSLLTWMWVVQGQWDYARDLFWLDLSLGALAFWVVLYRRRWPVRIAIVANLLSAFSGVAGGPAILASVSLATRRRLLEMLPIGTLIVVSWMVFYQLQPLARRDPPWMILIVDVCAAALQMGWGLYIGSRRELVWNLKQRAEHAEADRDERVARARAVERSRIAQEMHDVLAHQISQVSLHAGVLLYRDDLSDQEVRASVQIILDRANESLRGLRTVLGVLKDTDSPDPAHAPLPSMDDIEDLVREACDAGMNVHLRQDLAGTPPVPERIGRTVYRVLQEGIANAHRHAPGARLDIILTGCPESGIELVLENRLGFGRTPTEEGLGLVGVSERVALVGGHIDHTVHNGAFRLSGWVPWVA